MAPPPSAPVFTPPPAHHPEPPVFPTIAISATRLSAKRRRRSRLPVITAKSQYGQIREQKGTCKYNPAPLYPRSSTTPPPGATIATQSNRRRVVWPHHRARNRSVSI